jgi:ribonuclease-3
MSPCEPGRASVPAATDLEAILQKLKLLEHGLYGLHQYGRNAPLDVEDIGPFYRLAEEIESDLAAWGQRLDPRRPTESSGRYAEAPGASPSRNPADGRAEATRAPGEADLDALQDSLGYRFRDLGLLRLALSVLHQPLAPETAAARQRLEFLGDAAWNFAVARVAFDALPGGAPGDLTHLRASWSSRAGLARLAGRLGLPTPDLAPPGPSQRVLAELLEAVLGAVVEDGGFDAILALAARVAGNPEEGSARAVLDAKSALQVATLARQEKLPRYRLVERRGPAHRPTFRVAVTVRGPAGEISLEAEGNNRQAAEQEAARLALLALGGTESPSHNIS